MVESALSNGNRKGVCTRGRRNPERTGPFLFRKGGARVQAIKVYRTRAGLTQAQLADRCGIAQAEISRYEHGVHAPSAATLQKLGNALGVSVWQFFWTEDLLEQQGSAERAVEEFALTA